VKKKLRTKCSAHVKTPTEKPHIFKLNPDYQHSVNTGKTKIRQSLQLNFLLRSIEGIKNVCESNGITLSSKSLTSLNNSQGQYVNYVNIDVVTKVTTTFLNSGVMDEGAFNERSFADEARKIAFQGSKRFSPFVGPKTSHGHENYMRQLYNFLAIIGDYMSMLILLKFPPDWCPPIKPHSILMFLFHRMEIPGTPFFFTMISQN
jgi:hypothetical protein